MSLKDSLNSALKRAAGSRSASGSDQGASPDQPDADAAARQEERERERARKWAAGEDLPDYYDDVTRARIARVRPRTMATHGKMDALIAAVRYVARQGVPGDIVECGVWRGGSMQAVALTLIEQGDTDRGLHLFDTFEGMPPPSEHDRRTRRGVTVSAQELLASSDRESRMWAVASLEDVREGMEEVGYPTDRIHYHKGLVEETVPGEAPERIAILRLDTDWYESTRHELEHLYDRLSPGGVLILDDYCDWDGARKATDEWLAATGTKLFLVPMGPGRIALKPEQ